MMFGLGLTEIDWKAPYGYNADGTPIAPYGTDIMGHPVTGLPGVPGSYPYASSETEAEYLAAGGDPYVIEQATIRAGGAAPSGSQIAAAEQTVAAGTTRRTAPIVRATTATPTAAETIAAQATAPAEGEVTQLPDWAKSLTSSPWLLIGGAALLLFLFTRGKK